MKRIISLYQDCYLLVTLITLSLLQNGCETFSEPMEIADENFMEALIELGIDTDEDGIISSSEARAVTSLDIPGGYDIQSLEGIEAFKNLDSLDCYGIKISSLDLTSNTDLVYLNCGRQDHPMSLNISNCLKLRTLIVSGVNSLSLQNHTALKKLAVQYSDMTSLDVSKNTELKEIYVFSIDISSLDLSHNNKLTKVWLNYLQEFSALDLSNNTSLIRLRCSGCGLTTLDLSNNTDLVELECSWNQLSNLDISNNTDLTDIGIHDMPTLYEVCVWTMPFPPEGVDVMDLYSPNVYFTTDCSQ